MINEIIDLIKTKKYYDDSYEIPWLLKEGHTITNAKKLRIALINVPCGGYGDIIVCQTLYEYLRKWYPQHDIIICTTTPIKFKDLGINTRGYIKIGVHGDDECELYNLMYFKNKPKQFDIMICVPIINYSLNINQFKKLIPYANLFNTFSVS